MTFHAMATDRRKLTAIQLQATQLEAHKCANIQSKNKSKRLRYCVKNKITSQLLPKTFDHSKKKKINDSSIEAKYRR